MTGTPVPICSTYPYRPACDGVSHRWAIRHLSRGPTGGTSARSWVPRTTRPQFCTPPPFEIKTGTYSARRRPVRSHRRALSPSARRTTTPAHHSQLYPCSCFFSALDACRCVCLHICGLSADGAVRSAAAPARLAQPRTITFQILRKFDQKSGGRYSGVYGTKAVVFILYHQKYRSTRLIVRPEGGYV